MNFSNKLKLCAPKPARTQSPKPLYASIFRMTEQEDIKRRIDKMTEIIILTRTSLSDIEYIFNSLKDRGPTKYDKLFSRLWNALWYHVIIESAKLFDSGRQGYFGFKKLNNLIANNYQQLSWKTKPTLGEINNRFEQFYTDPRIKAVVATLKTARDEHFAHSDLLPTNFEVKSEEIKYFLDKSGELINFNCIYLFDYQQHFDLSKSDLQQCFLEPLLSDNK